MTYVNKLLQKVHTSSCAHTYNPTRGWGVTAWGTPVLEHVNASQRNHWRILAKCDGSYPGREYPWWSCLPSLPQPPGWYPDLEPCSSHLSACNASVASINSEFRCLVNMIQVLMESFKLQRCLMYLGKLIIKAILHWQLKYINLTGAFT